MIPGILARAERLFAGAPAVVDGDRTWTYRELALRVAALAQHLRAAGLAPGDRVALLAPNSRLFLESYFAAAHAGLVLVPLNWRAHPEGLARVMAHAQARGLIAAPRFEPLARAALAAWPAGDAAPPRLIVAHAAFEAELDGAARSRVATQFAAHAASPDDPAQLYYTSGTTGEPKGVILTHKNVASHALLAAAALELGPNDVWGHIAPMFHLADAWATFAITWVGGRHVMVPDFEPERVLDLLAGGITITNLVPTMLTDLVHRTDAATRQYRTLRRMLSGGAPIAPALVEKVMATFRCEYVQTYGLTETSPYLTLSLLPDHLAQRPPAEQFTYRCKTGRPLTGVAVRVARDDGSDVRADGREVGEVVCRGDTVTPGYWRNPAATAAAFRDGWFLTGDLAVLDAEGFLQIVDRKKDVIKTGGETVFSTEVEKVLHAHPSIQEVAVVGVPHERWGEAVVAVVVSRAQQGVDESTLIAHCRAHLGTHQVPKRIVFMAALPRTGSGKVEKRTLRDRLAAQRGASAIAVVALVAVLAVLGGVAWWLLRERPVTPNGGTTATQPKKSDVAPDAAAAPEQAKNLVVERALEKVTPVAESTHVAPAPASYLEALSGVRGRLVESDGTPIANKKVELYELKLEPFMSSFDTCFNALPEDLGHFDVAATESGEDGVFNLKGALAESFHLLGVDFGGMRPTFRILDDSLERGKLCDLGDIVLSPALTLTGKVVDDDGAPVAGARVRALPQLPIPPQVLEAGLQDIRPDSVGIFMIQPMQMVFELPPWARTLMERLPFPMTTSGTDGAFTLAGAPTGIITVLCDKPGRLGVVKGGIPTGKRKEQNVGTLTLTSGRTITGHVAAGKTPIVGARVYLGAAIEVEKEHVAIGQPAGRTDADGRFALTGVPVNGGPCVALQLEENGPFELFGPFDGDDVKIELPPRAPLTVKVHDAAGKPVDHAEIRFMESGPRGMVPFLLKSRSLKGNMKEEAGGVYRFDALPVGKWEVVARADGFGVGRHTFDFGADGMEVEVLLPPEFRAQVHVVDAASGAPVEFALVSALCERGMEDFGIPSFCASARTDRDGRCELRRLPLITSKLVVRAQHSMYVVAAAKLPVPADPSLPATVELKCVGGGSLAGHVKMAGEPPPKRLMLMVESQGEHDALEQSLPLFALTDGDGAFRIAHIAAGKHHYQLYTRFLGSDPIGFLPDRFKDPDELASGDVTVEDGKEATLEIEATPLDQLAPGTVRGVVRRDGRPAAGLEVVAMGRNRQHATTDETGRFEVTDVKPGDVHLRIAGNGNGNGNGNLYATTLKLQSAEVRDLAIDLRYVEVVVFVHDAGGKAISGASVNASLKAPAATPQSSDLFEAQNVWANTGGDGRVTIAIATPGPWEFKVQSDDSGRGSATADVPARGLDHPVEITLDPGVRCSGRVELEGAPSSDEPEWVWIAPTESANGFESGAQAQVDWSRKTFEAKGLTAGTWRATLYSNGGQSMMSQPFTLTSQGDTNVVLRFKEH